MTDGRHGSSVEESLDCPLCLEPLDDTERGFKPCPCGYQMCTFCWDRVSSDKCPACRRGYNPDSYAWIEVSRLPRSGEKKGHKSKVTDASAAFKSKKSLFNIRVIQRNLVYVKNLALEIAKEEILKQQEYFGQYGKIIKMVINRSHVYQGASVSCYVTYSTPEEACLCIRSIDGFELRQRKLRASFGTTKYCSYFLRNKTCTNSDCMYLHSMSEKEDNFTKEDMQVGKHLLRVPSFVPLSQTDPGYVQSIRSGFPPPRAVVQPQRLESREDGDAGADESSRIATGFHLEEGQCHAHSRDLTGSNRVKSAAAQRGVAGFKSAGHLAASEGFFAVRARSCSKSKVVRGFKKYVPRSTRHEGNANVPAGRETGQAQDCGRHRISDDSEDNSMSAFGLPDAEECSTDSAASPVDRFAQHFSQSRAANGRPPLLARVRSDLRDEFRVDLRGGLADDHRVDLKGDLGVESKGDRSSRSRSSPLLEGDSPVEARSERALLSSPEHLLVDCARNPAEASVGQADGKKSAYPSFASMPTGVWQSFAGGTLYDDWTRAPRGEDLFQGVDVIQNCAFGRGPMCFESESYLADSGIRLENRGLACEEYGYYPVAAGANFQQKSDFDRYDSRPPSYFYSQFDDKPPFGLDGTLHCAGDFNFQTRLDAASARELPKLVDQTCLAPPRQDTDDSSSVLISDAYPSERLVHVHSQNYVCNEHSIVVDDLNLSAMQVPVPRPLAPRLTFCPDPAALPADSNPTHHRVVNSDSTPWPNESLPSNSTSYSNTHNRAPPSGNHQLHGTFSPTNTTSNSPPYEHSCYGKQANPFSPPVIGHDEHCSNQKHTTTHTNPPKFLRNGGRPVGTEYEAPRYPPLPPSTLRQNPDSTTLDPGGGSHPSPPPSEPTPPNPTNDIPRPHRELFPPNGIGTAQEGDSTLSPSINDLTHISDHRVTLCAPSLSSTTAPPHPALFDHHRSSQQFHQKKIAQPPNLYLSQLRWPLNKTPSESVAPPPTPDPHPKPSPTHPSIFHPLSNGHPLSQHNIWSTPSIDDKHDSRDPFSPINQPPGQFILYSLGQNRTLSHHLSPNNP
ncbi:uncharacterized protein LOC126323770 [Schistocerca gregaria]|uniref:uncharacterized protein LOC126323770 n=1 Tax=Schistocerca gregaria TaxID=7010 RepID=UPI00211E33C1|nr:uncharacterized protein LOC126323770 [Schistocerca gregaria]